jgi:hypothetical protein
MTFEEWMKQDGNGYLENENGWLMAKRLWTVIKVLQDQLTIEKSVNNWTKEGYVLVPREPTESMIDAFEDAMLDDGWDADAIGEIDKRFVIKAMIQAAQDQD